MFFNWPRILSGKHFVQRLSDRTVTTIFFGSGIFAQTAGFFALNALHVERMKAV